MNFDTAYFDYVQCKVIYCNVSDSKKGKKKRAEEFVPEFSHHVGWLMLSQSSVTMGFEKSSKLVCENTTILDLKN